MTIPPSSHHVAAIGRAAEPEAWRYQGGEFSFLDKALRCTYRTSAAGEDYVSVSVALALFRDEGIVGAVVLLRRAIERGEYRWGAA